MKILLVWESIPERTDFYQFEGTDEGLTYVTDAHGQIIGADKNSKAAERLFEFLEGKRPMDASSILDGPFDRVVHSGFYL